MKDCYYDLQLHFILLDDYSQSYILKLRDRHPSPPIHRRQAKCETERPQRRVTEEETETGISDICGPLASSVR